MNENINFTSIDEHFTYLAEISEDKEKFKENLLHNILKNYEDVLDEKLNKFIELVLETYPIMFSNVKAKKIEKNKHNFLNKAKHLDKDLKEKLFLSEVSDGDFIAAADTLYKKNFYTNTQDCSELEIWNSWINTEISVSDMSKLLQSDIIHYVDGKKIKKIEVLKKYLKQEILLRISNLSLQEKKYKHTDEYVSYVASEKKLIAEGILLAFEDDQTPEKIWDFY